MKTKDGISCHRAKHTGACFGLKCVDLFLQMRHLQPYVLLCKYLKSQEQLNLVAQLRAKLHRIHSEFQVWCIFLRKPHNTFNVFSHTKWSKCLYKSPEIFCVFQLLWTQLVTLRHPKSEHSRWELVKLRPTWRRVCFSWYGSPSWIEDDTWTWCSKASEKDLPTTNFTKLWYSISARTSRRGGWGAHKRHTPPVSGCRTSDVTC